MTQKWVYWFKEGGEHMRPILGGKGAGLAEMTRIGLPVPPGFTISTQACIEYYKQGQKLPSGLWDEVEEHIKGLEETTGKKFGGSTNPLLVSVRSGAAISMPGMMDTILNLGLNEDSVQGLYRQTNDMRFALDCQRRFMQMFGDVVLGVDHDEFEHILAKQREEENVKYDHEISVEGLKKVIEGYRRVVKEKAGIEFPNDPMEQLRMAVEAVFKSWNNERAIVYRKINKIPDDLGTAVNVQMMVFGNMGSDSGTGVMFTRNPSTGAKELYGEYLINAQGEDVVAGIRTPKPIAELEREMPEVYKQLTGIFEKLEKHYRDMQDVEFTIQQGRLFILQTRNGKRTAPAAVKIAVDMVKEGLITKEEALLRVEPAQLDQLLHKRIDPSAKVQVIASGVAASPGAAVGSVVFTADEAAKLGSEGKKIILVRKETSPDDIHGMAVSQGILTTRGGKTSHAAVVARGMGIPCVSGCEAITVIEAEKKFIVGDVTVKEGDVITLDGSQGKVILGAAPLIDPTIGGDFKTLMDWADEVRSLEVRANGDTPTDARTARNFGAQGIGLCRTEHMFFAAERVPIVQEMILAETTEARKRALDKLLPMQKDDFVGILREMNGLPVIIRLLDPPLHEFLPSHEELLVEVTKLKMSGAPETEIKEKEALLARVDKLREINPMLGHRGCRLGITYPEITEMQARAIFEAACELTKQGYKILPEVMIPVVGHVNEIAIAKEIVDRVAKEVIESYGVKLDYKVGTMIELPRAALTADEIAKEAEFFSFGTNDLTQTTFGYSRDDAEGKFLPYYLDHNILEHNPFEVLDRKGVGELIKIAVEKGRKTRPDLEVGICGEHGGEPSSIEFCHMNGLDYVSCSPYRVPIARLAAAQAELRHPRKGTQAVKAEYTTA